MGPFYYVEVVCILIGIAGLIVACLSLRGQVNRLEKIVRDNWSIQKWECARRGIFETKQKQINYSVDNRIVAHGERLQKTRQSLASLRRDALLNDGLIAETDVGKRNP
jgi:hypothetical protein